MRIGSAIGTTIGRLLGLLTLGTASARDLSGLQNNNPFGGATASREKPAEVTEQLELRGVVREKDGYLLNLYDTQTKKSTWVREGEQGGAFVIRSYNRGSETAVIEAGGRNLSLALKTGRPGVSIGASSAMVASVAAQLQIKAQAMAATAPPPSEVLRMEQVSQEVRLRREQRRKNAASDGISKT